MSSLRSRLVRLYFKWRRLRANPDMSIEQMRQRMDKFGAYLPLPDLCEVEQVEVEGRPAEWIVPEDAKENRTLLYIHGGAFSVGSCASHRGLVGYIACATRARTLLPEYRLAPEHPFPAALDDSIAAYRALLDSGIAPEEIIIAGDSAGGGLALSALVSLRDAGEPLPAAVILLSPWVDLSASGESMQSRANQDPWLLADRVEPTAARYYGTADPEDPLVSPLYADLHDLPPMFIQVGDDEILLSDATRLAEKAGSAGVDVTLEIWDGMWHIWQAFVQFIPESREAIERIGRFVDAKTEKAEQQHEEIYV